MAEINIEKMAQNVAEKAMQELRDNGVFVSRWIPVSERSPEDGTWNLFTDGKQVSVERYKADALDHFYPNGRWFSLDEAIAWMPLPKRYGPQESEEQSLSNSEFPNTWQKHTDASGNSWHVCPACGHIAYTLTRFCPDCGARLEAPS